MSSQDHAATVHEANINAAQFLHTKKVRFASRLANSLVAVLLLLYILRYVLASKGMGMQFMFLLNISESVVLLGFAASCVYWAYFFGTSFTVAAVVIVFVAPVTNFFLKSPVFSTVLLLLYLVLLARLSSKTRDVQKQSTKA